MLRSAFSSHLPKPEFSPPDRRASLERLAVLLQSGQLVVPIARRFDLARASEALEEFTRGTALGKIVLTV
jgi:NADPH:quinone reductase-like Zn-dependent oxidoreductase